MLVNMSGVVFLKNVPLPLGCQCLESPGTVNLVVVDESVCMSFESFFTPELREDGTQLDEHFFRVIQPPPRRSVFLFVLVIQKSNPRHPGPPAEKVFGPSQYS